MRDDAGTIGRSAPAALPTAALLEYIADAVFVVDRDWRLTYLNPRAERLLRRPRADLLGRTLWEVAPEVVGSAFECECRRAVDAGTSADFEERFPSLDSWFAVRAHAVPDGLAVFLQDIGVRKAAEAERERLVAALAAAEARYHGMFAGVGDALLVADAAGRYVDANPAAERLLGYTRAELLGLGVADVMVLAPDETRAMYAAFVRQGWWRGEVELRRKDGAIVPAEGQATALPEGDLYVSALRDISERRALEREREAFLAAISHDLKNPLATIRGAAQLVQRRLARIGQPEAARQAAQLDAITASAVRMTALLDELLDQARLREGQAPDLVRRPADLVALARRVAAEAQGGTTGHRLTVAVAVPELSAPVDAARLERVLQNLLSNAIKYSPAGGAVTLGVDREPAPGGAWAALTVRDEGVGIPAADLPRLFERFRRGSNVVGRIAGTGLGLATARQIVEAHGGTIALESAEGTGTTVTVRLPLVEPGA